MKRITQFLVSLLITILAGYSVATAQPTDRERVESNISQRIAEGPLVGVSVGYIAPDGEISYLTKGNLSSEKSQKVTPQSVFKIGSVTKVFTTLALARFIDERSITLETKADSLLGPKLSLPAYEGQEITLRDLVTHTSGLPRLPGNLQMLDPQNPYKEYSESKLQQFLADYKLTREPGSRFQYSNLGMAIVGHILEEQYDMSYDQIIKQIIARPLQMQRAGIHLPAVDSSAFTRGHKNGNPVPYWDFPAVEAMGGLKSTTIDLTTFIKAHLGSRNSLSTAISMVQDPLFDIGKSNKRVDKVGMGWMLSTEQDSIWWHNGGTGGYSSFVGMNAETGAGVVVLSNTQSSIDDIGFHLLDQNHQLDQMLSAQKLEKYVGQYKLNAGISYNISRDKNQLYVQKSGQQKIAIYPEKDHVFSLKVVNAKIEFAVTQEGVQKLVLHQNGQQYSAQKVN